MNLAEGPSSSEQERRPIRVFHVGLGAMGLAIARALEARPEFTIVGAVSHQVGQPLAKIVGPSAGGEVLTGPPDDPAMADLCVIATASMLSEIEETVCWALEHRMNVISCAEELTFPSAADSTISASLDAAAHTAARTVLGTGINPGYAMDILPICLTAPCLSVRAIKIKRVNDLRPYGPSVLRSFGIGASPMEFETGLASGEIVGHRGFAQSIGMIARAVGFRIDEIREKVSPVIAVAPRRGADIVVGPGQIAGCVHTAVAYSDDRAVIRMEHPQEVDPSAEGTSTGDFIQIDGDPPIDVRIEPEIAGGIGTAALVVNMAGRVVDAAPGLLTMDKVGLPSIAPSALWAARGRPHAEPVPQEAGSG